MGFATHLECATEWNYLIDRDCVYAKMQEAPYYFDQGSRMFLRPLADEAREPVESDVVVDRVRHYWSLLRRRMSMDDLPLHPDIVVAEVFVVEVVAVGEIAAVVDG